MRKLNPHLPVLTLALIAVLASTAGCGGQTTPTPSSTPSGVITPSTASTSTPASSPVATPAASTPGAFYIFLDAGLAGNHFVPSGFMGDVGDIVMDAASTVAPHSGATALRFQYSPKGRGPNSCNYGPPCDWAGVYWLQPANNWGKEAKWKGQGYDLSGYRHLRFFARAQKPITIEFKVGGIIADYGDSLSAGRTIAVDVTTDWKEFDIDLTGTDLSHIIGGFSWAIGKDRLAAHGYQDIEFFLDDIRFER